MNKQILFLTLAILFLFQSISAQQPETIDVKTFSIHHEANWTDAYFTMTAKNASGSIVTYDGKGNYFIPSLMNCVPCNMPNIFSGNGFFSGGFGLSFNWAFDSPVQFRVSSIEASPIVLRPTILRKKQRFSVNGSVTVRGRIEIRQPSGILAVDDDVVLTGTYAADFLQNYFLPGRKVQYTKINYNLNQVP